MTGIRINVLGASGSGSTTVGRSLAAALNVPHFDSDDYYHAPSNPPFQNPRSPEERYEMVRGDLAPAANWVLSGGIIDWEPCPDLDFTGVVFLYLPTPERVERLRRREQERFGERVLTGGDMHQLHEEFIEWASHYDVGGIEGKTLARHEAYLQSQRCPVWEFREIMEVSEITQAVLQSFSND